MILFSTGNFQLKCEREIYEFKNFEIEVAGIFLTRRYNVNDA